jgi:uncharacterized protein with von Willebrand factor type A (vWA) domain
VTALAREQLEGFLAALAASGVPVLAPRRIDFLRAVAITPLRSLDDLYWVARVTLVAAADQIEPFDRAFAAWFRSGWAEQLIQTSEERDDESETERPGADPDGATAPIELGEGTGRAASPDELLHHRHLPVTTEDERFIWAQTIEAAGTAMPRTGGRRHKPARRTGDIDLRRVLRDARRTGGDIVHLRYRRRPRRMRRVLLLIDVSGSLKANSPDFLRFAHALVQGAERVEVFTFGTRLTHITPALRRPDLDDALSRLSSLIFDFDGGTRIGEAFATLLANSRFVSFARGAVIIVLSDGLERGDPALMAETTERMARLGHRLLWLTPMAGDPAYRPATRGMQAILGSLDRLGDSSSPHALLNELRRLPEIEQRPRRRVQAQWQERRRAA